MAKQKKRPTVELDPNVHLPFSIINTARGITNRGGASEALRPYIKKHAHLLPEDQKERFLATA